VKIMILFYCINKLLCEKIKTKEEKFMLGDKKGITLVALVVTIVALLILAGVSINLVLGNNGIIAKAKDAETKSAEASQNDLKEMSNLEDEMDKQLGTYDPLKKIPTKTLEEAKVDFVKEKTKVEFSDGNVIIPEGLKIADVPASKVRDGVVIEDKDGNQFVWVPVATIADYKRTWYTGNDLFSEYLEALPEDEKTSVERYKGFYIGRYEVGDKENTEAKTLRSSNDVTKTVTIKANQAPYNYVTRTQAISLAEGFATKQGYKAKTKLVSSYAWDTTISFLQKVNSDYGSSSEEGNYYNTTFSYTDITGASQIKAESSTVLVPTGQTTPVCNIFDMGGNVWEWTTESYSNTGGPCTIRGGLYSNDFAIDPAGRRGVRSDIDADFIGFRLTLFI
jgi:hypothetical protein